GLLSSAVSDASSGCSQRANLAQLEEQLSRLRIEFTEKHPRVVTLEETIVQLEADCGAELEAAAGFGSLAPSSAQPLEANPVYQNLRIQLSNAEVELVELRARLATEQATVEQLRRDVDKITQ